MALAWLSQTGFVLRIGEAVILVDPNLSDHPAEPYRCTRVPHVRLMPALIAHHFALFAFNAADPIAIDAAAARQAALGRQPGFLPPDTRHAFLLRQEAQDA